MSRRPVGSIRWLSDGVARVELESGRDPITGERRRLSETVYGSSSDAERALAKMLLEIGKLPAGRNMTVREYYENIYQPRLEKGRHAVRRETRRGYFSKIENHVLPRFGDVALADLEPYVLDDWLDSLLEKMSAQSALHVYRAFSGALSKAVKWRFLKTNPLRDVDAPSVDERALETLSAEEVLTYLNAFEGHSLEALVIVALSTGLRPCELYALTWADLDFSGFAVSVEKGLHQDKEGTYFEPPKSKRSNRLVSLDGWAIEALRPLRGLGAVAIRDGKQMTPAQVGYHYRKQVREKKLRYLPLRDLRHTHATLMLEAGVELAIVSRRLGHSTVTITDKHYLRPKRTADQKAADAFGDLLAVARGKSSGAGKGGKSKAEGE